MVSSELEAFAGGGCKSHGFMVICMILTVVLTVVTPLLFLIKLLLTYKLILVAGVQHNDLIGIYRL